MKACLAHRKRSGPYQVVEISCIQLHTRAGYSDVVTVSDVELILVG